MEVLAPSRDTHLQMPERSRLSLLSHQRILEAIQAGSVTQARKAMEDHVGHVDWILCRLAEEALSLSTELSVRRTVHPGECV
jgi:DNA-binding FadR family transcriptional regulator